MLNAAEYKGKNGGPGATRTPDLLIRRPMLSINFIISFQQFISLCHFYFGIFLTKLLFCYRQIFYPETYPVHLLALDISFGMRVPYRRFNIAVV